MYRCHGHHHHAQRIRSPDDHSGRPFTGKDRWGRLPAPASGTPPHRTAPDVLFVTPYGPRGRPRPAVGPGPRSAGPAGRHQQSAATAFASRGEAYSVPQTKRITGPYENAAGSPVK